MSGKSAGAAYVAAAANLIIAVIKFAAAWFTGSSAMWSEGIHSVVDTCNEGLLIYGLHRAAAPPDEAHPFGHGRELYFWSFIVALLIFSLGAGFAAYEGINSIRNPSQIESPLMSLGVLVAAALFEGWSWSFAYRKFREEYKEGSLFEAIVRSKNPAVFVVLLEDTAALTGVAIAFLGVCLSAYLNIPIADGAASLGVAAVLGFTAIFLAREAKGLLIGEPALKSVGAAIRQKARRCDGIEEVRELLTFQLGPDQIVALMNARFSPGVPSENVARIIAQLESDAKKSIPGLIALYVNPASG